VPCSDYGTPANNCQKYQCIAFFTDRGIVRNAGRAARRKIVQFCTVRLYSVVHSSHEWLWLFLGVVWERGGFMPCPVCASVKQVEFSFEMMVHRNDLKNMDNPSVLVLQKALVCLDCGSAQFTVPKSELALLASDPPDSERRTMAAAR
jgi:hypothetical protein